MAKNTEISWCDDSFNCWIGCRKISSGCDFCYAEKVDRRFGGNHWEGEYKRMADSNWKQPIAWNKKAEKSGKRRKVFCGSMCDWADSRGPESERERLWELIRKTPMLDWLMLTKRANNITKYLPEDWGNGYDNVWIGVTVEDRKFGLPRIDILRNIPAKIHFLSAEPLLEDLGLINLDGIDWVIAGGESGPGARIMKEEWVKYLQWHCQMQNTSFLFKQWGRNDNDGADKKEPKGGNLLTGRTHLEFPGSKR